jgi:hypothetical protein
MPAQDAGLTLYNLPATSSNAPSPNLPLPEQHRVHRDSAAPVFREALSTGTGSSTSSLALFNSHNAAQRGSASSLTHLLSRSHGAPSSPHATPETVLLRSGLPNSIATSTGTASAGSQSVGPSPPFTGATAKPSSADINRIANKVYEILVSRLASERQRRGG